MNLGIEFLSGAALPPMEDGALTSGPPAPPPVNPLQAMADVLKARQGTIDTAISAKELERRTEYAFSLGLRSMVDLQDKFLGQTAIVCGAGHSLDFEAVRQAKVAGGKVFVVNTVHDPMIRAGIVPDFSVMLDPNERVADYQTPHPDVTYLLGSGCHPKVWRRFRDAGASPYMFVPIMTDTQHDEIMERFPEAVVLFIPGQTTVGLRTAGNIVPWMGFETSELHGFDSCYAPGNDGVNSQQLYAVPKPVIHHDAREFTIVANPRRHRFTCRSNGAMARQAQGFHALLAMASRAEVNGRVGQHRFRVAGDGAIPWMAWKAGGEYAHHTDPDRMAAKYGDAEHWDFYRGKAYG